AKMRLGWDDRNITAPDLARALEAVGAAAIFVHGRTREQGFGGQVNLAGIRAAGPAVSSISGICDGGVRTPQGGKTMIDETGCAGVSIGRGAFYNPWIFQHTLHHLRTTGGGRRPAPDGGPNAEDAAHGVTRPTLASGELLPEPSFAERVRVMCRHLDLM